jgi:imidazolonepropionase-like amidohydrolase
MVSQASVLFAAIFFTTLTAPNLRADDSDWTLRAKRAYLSPETAPRDNVVVGIAADRIRQVQAADSAQRASEHSGCDGGIVVAGFQNSHVHFMGSEFEAAASAQSSALSAAMRDMLLRYGYTTVVDTGSVPANTFALRRRVDSGEVQGPRILTTGRPLFPAKGLPFYLDHLPHAVLDELALPESVEEAVRVVDENISLAANGTKLFIATPQADGSVRRMDADLIRAVIDRSHRAGRLAMAHPTDAEGVRAGIAGGIDIFVHTIMGPWPEELVQGIVDNDVAVVPTLKLWGYELAKGGVPDAVRQELIDAALAQVRALSRAGAQILFGTDVGYMTDYDPLDEYVLMERAGMSPMQILASLTTNPARRWSESDQRGRIEPGMQADLVVLDGDPAQDVRNFAKVRCVFRGGRLLYASGASAK